MKLSLSATAVTVILFSWVLGGCNPTSLAYEGQLIKFPSTVEEVTSRLQLSYTPSGYFFKELSRGSIMRVEFTKNTLDTWDEYAPATKFADRDVEAYYFTYPDKGGVTYNELKKSYNRNFPSPGRLKKTIGMNKLKNSFKMTQRLTGEAQTCPLTAR